MTTTTGHLDRLIAKGESDTLKLKRSTGELREALKTVCAFANGSGGKVLIGVRPDGRIVGQHVSEQTLHEIASWRDRFEPPIDITVAWRGRARWPKGRVGTATSEDNGVDLPIRRTEW